MKSIIEEGCLDIWIDDIVFCLKDTETDELKETIVFKIESRSYLKSLNEQRAGILTGMRCPKR